MNDGFMRLEYVRKPEWVDRMNNYSKDDKKSKDSKPKTKKNPFKKGSWKYYLAKMLYRIRKPQHVNRFHNEKHHVIFLQETDDKSGIYEIIKIRPKTKQLKKLLNKKKNVYVLVDCYDNKYYRIPLESYIKLTELESLIVEYKVSVMEDGEDEFVEMYQNRNTINNIQELFDNIIYYSNLITGIGEIQILCCWYTMYNVDFRVVTKDRSGTYKAYKDINLFLKEYDLGLL